VQNSYLVPISTYHAIHTYIHTYIHTIQPCIKRTIKNCPDFFRHFLTRVKGLALGASGFEAPLIRSGRPSEGGRFFGPASNPEGPKARPFSYAP